MGRGRWRNGWIPLNAPGSNKSFGIPVMDFGYVGWYQVSTKHPVDPACSENLSILASWHRC